MAVDNLTNDVFISYNWRDRSSVELVARALQSRGVSTFLDRWYLVPGRPWSQVLEEALNACGAVAIFLGPNGMGNWQQREKDLALERQGRDPNFPGQTLPWGFSRSTPGWTFEMAWKTPRRCRS